MDATYKRYSRRSHPNLTHLSVTPLTPQYPLPLTADPPSPLNARSNSYIQPKSLPQTPSLLSRFPSRTRHRSNKSTQALSELSRAFTPLHPSKSTGQLTKTSIGSIKTTKGTSDSTAWLLRTASLLTASTVESKGQAWLATRDSSTSLENYGYTPSINEPTDMAYKADDEFSPVSMRYSRPGSRPGSRFASARGSRRGSRVGVMTPMGIRTPGEEERASEEYFGAGVDFVDEDEEEGEEGEMRRVVWGMVGGWVDWAVGWMDFRIDGEVEGEEKVEKGAQEGEVQGKKKRRRRVEGDRIVVQGREEAGSLEVPPPEGDGGWRDAAWLLGIAKEILV